MPCCMAMRNQAAKSLIKTMYSIEGACGRLPLHAGDQRKPKRMQEQAG